MKIRNDSMLLILGWALAACGAHDSGNATRQPGSPDALAPEGGLALGGAEVTSIESPEGVELSSEEAAILALLNRERKSRHLFELKISYELSGVARAHSLEMAAAGDAYHDSPKTGGVGDRVRSINYDFTFLAENVGAGEDPQTLHDGWMQSEGHRKNLLHPDARQVGIGLAAGTLDGARVLYGTQVFASKAPTLNPAKVAQYLLEVANATRKSEGMSVLTPHKGLTDAAVQNQNICFGGGQINLLGTDWHQGKVGAKLFTLASTDNITKDDIGPMLDPAYQMVGLHVVQETDPNTGANMVCVILILGATD